MKLIFILFSLQIFILNAIKYRQEWSKVDYYNPKYIKEANTLTVRGNRSAPYRTNMTIVSKVTLVNTTIKIQHKMKDSAVDFEIRKNKCDIAKIKWIMDFLKAYSNIGSRLCVSPPGEYKMYNIEITPKTIPLPFPRGLNIMSVSQEITDTEELITRYSIGIYVD